MEMQKEMWLVVALDGRVLYTYEDATEPSDPDEAWTLKTTTGHDAIHLHGTPEENAIFMAEECTQSCFAVPATLSWEMPEVVR